MKKSPSSTSTPINFPWKAFHTLSQSGYLSEKYGYVSEETYLFSLKKANYDKVVQSALTSLQITDPKNATPERARFLADMMIVYAKMVIREIRARRKRFGDGLKFQNK